MWRHYSLAFLFLLCSCEGFPPNLEVVPLFSLSMGRSENSVDMFSDIESPGNFVNDLVIHQGSVYLVNGQSTKVMVFSSFGDLLRMYYDPMNNPPPISLSQGDSSQRVATRIATAYPFFSTGPIAVTAEGDIFIVQGLHPEQAILDNETGSVLRYMILFFSSEGKLKGAIGQEGWWGTPFPHIESLWMREDELVVVCQVTRGWQVFTYSLTGEFQYQVIIDKDRLPIPHEEVNIAILNRILPSKSTPELYLYLDYFEESIDEETGGSFQINYYGSRVYTLDLQREEYSRFFNATFDSKEEGEYFLLGVSHHNDFFFFRTVDLETLEIFVVNENGRPRIRYYHTIDPVQDLIMKVNTDDSLSTLLIRESEVDILWMRTDKLLR